MNDIAFEPIRDGKRYNIRRYGSVIGYLDKNGANQWYSGSLRITLSANDLYDIAQKLDELTKTQDLMEVSAGQPERYLAMEAEMKAADSYTPDYSRIFVFGSNLAGRHFSGAAEFARKHHGANIGIGYGLEGTCFAIPTKDFEVKTLPLPTIQIFVSLFLYYASRHPEFQFNVTRIGCGLAGYTDAEIGPMFKGAPLNCDLPEGWG